ncbi:DUF4398 domain-containing protein [Deferrisoma camini]|uniref:DUF4398 domain-containing protein n=1 Tax=Deferrisoma camini TaxID=1035120 RepID=UPI00046CD95D|nr:DUF4398 domain-containing protein [Deferrisoma camini]
MGWKPYVAVAAALVLLGGCSTLNTLEQAHTTLERAKEAGAEVKAPYAFHKAQSFLEMAEHEKDEFDWRAASEWAKVALDSARQALDGAKGGSK